MTRLVMTCALVLSSACASDTQGGDEGGDGGAQDSDQQDAGDGDRDAASQAGDGDGQHDLSFFVRSYTSMTGKHGGLA